MESLLGGGSSWIKAIIFLIIIPLIIAAVVFLNIRSSIGDIPALGFTVIAFFVTWALMTKVITMA